LGRRLRISRKRKREEREKECKEKTREIKGIKERVLEEWSWMFL